MKTLAKYLAEYINHEIEDGDEVRQIIDEDDLETMIEEGLDTIELARVIRWPESQICQECEHGKLLLDMPSGDTACMKAVHPIGGRCKYLSRKELDTNDS